MRQTNHHSFRQWLVALSAPSHYLNQCWTIVNWTLRNKLQQHFNRNSNIFIQENAFESIVCNMAFTLPGPQYVKTNILIWYLPLISWRSYRANFTLYVIQYTRNITHVVCKLTPWQSYPANCKPHAIQHTMNHIWMKELVYLCCNKKFVVEFWQMLANGQLKWALASISNRTSNYSKS